MASKYDEMFRGKPLGPVESIYPKIIIDDHVNNTTRTQVIPFTVEMLYDLLHHTHTADSLIGSSSSESGDGGDTGDNGNEDLDTAVMALLEIIGELTAVVGSLGGNVDTVVELIEELGGTVPGYESPDTGEPEPTETDKSSLKALIDAANNLKEEDYTEESWNNLQSVLTEAKSVYNDDSASQDDVDNMVDDLQNAIDSLEAASESVDKTALGDLLDKVFADLNEDDYTPSTWATMYAVYEEALEIYDSSTSSQDDVDNAVTKLQNAIDSLVERADKTALNEVLNSVYNLNEDDYTPTTWSAMYTVYEAALEIYNNLEASQDDVDNAVTKLQNAIDALVKRADKTTLGELIDEADAMTSDGFTEDSWNNLQDVLSVSKQVYDNADASQEEVDQAIVSLQEAIDALKVYVDKTALGELIAEAKELNEDDYTPSTWSTFKDMLDNAEKAYDSDAVTQEEVNLVVEYLQSTIDALVKRADKTTLVALMVQIDNMSEDDYTPSTWSALMTVLESANTVNDNLEASQDDVDAMVESLQEAIDALVKRADKTALGEVISSIDDMNEDDYTPTTWSAMYTVYEAALEIYNNLEASQNDVDSMADDLQNAINALVKRADKTALGELIDQVNSLDSAQYTEDTWNNLQTVFILAEELYNNADASQDDVDAMVESLQEAIDALKVYVDKTALGELIAEAKELNEDDYTPSTWSTFKDMLDNAEKAYDSDIVSQEEVNLVVEYLQSTIDALVKRADKTTLEATIALVSDLDEDEYTEDSWSALMTVLESANTIDDDLEASQDDVDNITDELQSAIDSLVKADYHASVVDDDGNTINCETLSEAVEKVADGGTITMLEDTVLDSELTVDKNVTIDLGEYSITGDPGTNLVTVSNYSDDPISVNITGGSIENTSTAEDTYYKALIIAGNADVTLTDVDLTCTSTFYGYGLQILTDEDGCAPNVTVGDGCDLEGGYCGIMIRNTKNNNSEYVTLTVEDGATISGALAISGNGTYDNTIITINGGIITSDFDGGCAIYNPQHGILTINGGTITGSNGVQMCDGELYLNGGTITGTSVDTRDSITSTSGNITDGAAISLVHRGSGYAEEDDEPKFIMTDGTCISTQSSALLAYGWTSNYEVEWDDKNFSITGGAFSDSSARDYIAEGYDLEYDVSSGNWIVVEVEPFVVTDENGNPVVCETLADAINAVADGGVVEVNEDVDLTDRLDIDKSMTLNLNGHIISGTGSTSVLRTFVNTEERVTLVINNGTIECTTTATDNYYRALGLYGNVEATLTNVNLISTSTFYGYALQAGSSDQEYAPTITIGENCVLEAGYAGVVLVGNGSDDSTTLIVEDGAVITGAFGISGNGTNDNTVLIINGGIITSNHDEGCGLYNPQHGTVTINGGTITGPTGVEMCDGELIITNGTITGTGNDTRASVTSTSGNIIDGAAVSIIHRSGYADEDDEPKANISNGTFISEQAASFLAYGWNRTSEVEWDDKDITISGGSYSDESVKDYLTDDYTLEQDGSMYTVTKA